MSIEDGLDGEILMKLVNPNLCDKKDNCDANYDRYWDMITNATILDPEKSEVIINLCLGQYDTTFFLQIYKIHDNKYTVLSPYLGSCSGCTQNLLDKISIKEVACDLLSKATIYNKYKEAIVAAQEIIIKNRDDAKYKIDDIISSGIFEPGDNRWRI